MHLLDKLFGNSVRAKVLRLFYVNPDSVFSPKEIARLSKIAPGAASREARYLLALGFLKSAARVDERVVERKNKKLKTIRTKIKGFALSKTFPLLLSLRHLVVTASPVSREKIIEQFKGKGKVKLVVLGGIFVEDPAQSKISTEEESRLDLLVVGDAIKKNKVDRFIENLGAEAGKELNWALMTALEFEQRMSMHDKFLRDLFDYPHECVINKLGIE
ncbi:hypothetical protein HYT01_04130 [Candidatus Giovannonibacteria bacterium]|nr:hypothetical protein [Candidatus Giovannonibacteria bacterium]